MCFSPAGTAWLIGAVRSLGVSLGFVSTPTQGAKAFRRA